MRYCLDSIKALILKTLISGVVSGQNLISWLLERGLVLSRQDGESFGRHLLRGRVIRHVDNHLDFYDDKYLYTFQPVSSE